MRQVRVTTILFLLVTVIMLSQIGSQYHVSYASSSSAILQDFQEFQAIPTNGAFDWEYFTIGEEKFLAVANQHDGPSVNIDSKIYKWNGTQFVIFQSIPTNGALDWEFFTIGSDSYLAAANYFNGTTNDIDSKIYKWDGIAFNEYQSIPTTLATHWEYFTIGSDSYLAVANAHSPTGGGYNVYSKIYKWNGSQFIEYQSLLTNSARAWEHFTINGDSYLVVANTFNGSSFNIPSRIYRWNGSSFVEFQTILTNGALEWEFFNLDGESYLAVANATNGSTSNIDSKIYRWDGSSFVEFQSIPTQNAFDWEYFTIGDDAYLAIPNYYDGSNFNLDSKVYKWNGSSFVEFQTIATNGAVDWEYFTIGDESYLALANNTDNSGSNIDSKLYKAELINSGSGSVELQEFQEYQTIPTNFAWDWESFTIGDSLFLAVANRQTGSSSEIYQWDGTNFVMFQTIQTDSAGDWEYFTIGNEPYLAVANAYNGTTGEIDSKIYKWNGSSFGEYQSLATKGAYDWEYFTIGGDSYLAVANSYSVSGVTHNILSKIYKWNGVHFVEFQSILTNASSDWDYFSIDGDSYLVVANNYNGSSFEINSKIYKWSGSNFVEYQSILTSAGLDWEYFMLDGESYLAVANGRNNAGSVNIDSKIYKWIGSYFVEFQSIATHNAFDWEFFTVGDKAYLTVANAHTGSSADVDSVIYLWNGTQFVQFQSIATHGARGLNYFTIDNNGFLAIANSSSGVVPNIDSIIYKAEFLSTNTPPTAGAGGPYNGQIGTGITLNNASASDPDGDNLTYTWNVDSPACSFTNANLLHATLICNDAGNYIATLTVNDGVNGSVSSETTIIVTIDPADILFFDEFTEDLSAWDILHGTWWLENQQLCAQGTAHGIDGWIYAGDTSWTDYSLETMVTFIDNNAELVLRSTGHWYNEYRISFWRDEPGYPYPNSYQVKKFRNGIGTIFTNDLPGSVHGNAPSPVYITNPAKLRVDVYGDVITVYINDQYVNQFVDPDPLTQGRIGLGVIWDYRNCFDYALATAAEPVSQSDLSVNTSGISFSPTIPNPAEPVTLNANIINLGTNSASDILVSFYDFDTLLGQTTISTLAAGAATNTSLEVAFADEGFHLVTVKVDPNNNIFETNESNNVASRPLQVGQPNPAEATMIVQADGQSTCQGGTTAISGHADYDFTNIPGVPDHPVQGGLVTVTILDLATNAPLQVFTGAKTSITGNFNQPILAPTLDGAYPVSVSVTDGTLTAETQATLTVSGECPIIPPMPPPNPGGSPPGATADVFLYSDDILFSDDNPDPGEPISIFAYINYVGDDPILNMPVTINDLYPVSGVLRSFPIDNVLVNFPDGGNSSPVAISIPWTNTSAGAHIVQVVTEPPFSQFTGNDKATRLIFVGDQPLLHIDKNVSFGDGEISPGDTVMYTITYENQGSSDVTNAVITDDYDETLLLTPTQISDGGSTDGGVITWNLGTLAAGGSGSVTYEVTLVPINEFPSGTTTIVNYALLSSDQTPPIAASQEIEVVVNHPPTAESQNVPTDEDMPRPITLTATDPENDALTFSLLTSPVHGVLSGTVPNLVYIPNPDFNGSDSFTFKANDGEFDSNVATIAITVNPVNDSPQANDDFETTLEDELITIQVDGNDTDVDGNLDPSSTIALSQPTQGSLTNNGDGSFDYQPFPNLHGSDSFIYQICDIDNACDEAVVNINITSVNDDPDCTGAVPSLTMIWPPDNRLVPITISGISDVENDPIVITIATIFQDELVGSEADGLGVGTDIAMVKAERQLPGNGRYYQIGFTAYDSQSGSCSDVVLVSVPKHLGAGGAAIDDGPMYDSTMP